MNIDLSSIIEFGDSESLKFFFIDHRFLHDAEAAALTARFGQTFGTFGISSESAERAWAELMEKRKGPTPPALLDWLQYHAEMHNQTFAALGGAGTVAPDLSIVDFSQPSQFFDWLFVHLEMHQYEEAALGLS